MSSHRVPHVSLSALRAFEALGRLGHLADAAEELHVSASAVSHQLRDLQATLGIALTAREGRGLVLTPQGAALAADLALGFEQIQHALQRALARQQRDVLAMTVQPWFASRWLIPRMADFQALHPEVDVRIATTARTTDLVREGYDCGIRYGRGHWPGVKAEWLMPGRVTALAHRTLVERLGAPKRMSDLARYRPLYAQSSPGDWAAWLRAAGHKGAPPAAAQTYDSRDLVMQAVLQGAGVGVVERTVLATELARGDLVQLFDVDAFTDWNYYLVSPDDVVPTPALVAFRSWLAGQCAASPAP